MPSETPGSDFVRCRMVNDRIPASICNIEQGGGPCEGCDAPTRRCKRCGKARGIADAKRGLCESCLENKADSTETSDEDLDGDLVSALDLVRAVKRQPAQVEKPRTTDKDKLGIGSVVKDLGRMHLAFMEHAVQKNGTWVVKMPRTILIRRIRMLPDEADRALATMRKSKIIQGSKPWEELILLKTDGIEAIKASLEGPRAQSTSQNVPKAGNRKRPYRTRQPVEGEQQKLPPQPASVPKPKPVIAAMPPTAPVAPPAPLHPQPPPSTGKTYAKAYAHLIEKAQLIEDERIVGGAVPTVQLKWSVGMPIAIQFLEAMLQDGNIEKRDGWRSIALLKEEINDDRPLTIPAVCKTSSASPAKGDSANPPRLRRGSGSRGSSPAPALPLPITQEPQPIPETLEQAIRYLEQRQGELGQIQGDISNEMSTIGSCLDLLRAQRRHAETDENIQALLKAVGDAVSNLQSALQKR